MDVSKLTGKYHPPRFGINPQTHTSAEMFNHIMGTFETVAEIKLLKEINAKLLLQSFDELK
jgi:hypothetical protein